MYILLFTLMMLLISCEPQENAAQAKEGEEKEAPSVSIPVTVKKISVGILEQYGDFLGSVLPEKEVNLVAFASGRVEKVHADQGELVKKGDALCRIDGERLRLNFEIAKLDEEIKRRQWLSTKEHFENGSSSKLKHDRDKVMFLQAKKNRLEADKVFKAAFCEAPFSGLVTQRSIREYDQLQVGAPTFRLANLDSVRVIVDVSENEYHGYKKNAPAQLSLSHLPSKTWEGKILNIALQVNNRSKTFVMELEFDNKDRALLPGASATVKVLKLRKEKAILIPSKAIQIQNGESIVFLAKNGVALAKKVVLGLHLDSKSEVLEGLSPGDKIVVDGADLVASGQSIDIQLELKQSSTTKSKDVL